MNKTALYQCQTKKLKLEIEELKSLIRKNDDEIGKIAFETLKKIFQCIIAGNDFWIVPLHDYFIFFFGEDMNRNSGSGRSGNLKLWQSIDKFLRDLKCCSRTDPRCRCLIIKFLFYCKAAAILDNSRLLFRSLENVSETKIGRIHELMNISEFQFAEEPIEVEDEKLAEKFKNILEKNRMINFNAYHESKSVIDGKPFYKISDLLSVDQMKDIYKKTVDFMRNNSRYYSLSLYALCTNLQGRLTILDRPFLSEFQPYSDGGIVKWRQTLLHLIGYELCTEDVVTVPRAKTVIELWSENEIKVNTKTMFLKAWKDDQTSVLHNSNLPLDMLRCIINASGLRFSKKYF